MTASEFWNESTPLQRLKVMDKAFSEIFNCPLATMANWNWQQLPDEIREGLRKELIQTMPVWFKQWLEYLPAEQKAELSCWILQESNDNKITTAIIAMIDTPQRS